MVLTGSVLIRECKKVKSKALVGVLCAVLSGVSWGFSGACGQYLFNNYGTDTFWLTAVRMICSGLILFLFSLPGGKWRLKGIGRGGVLRLFSFAILGLLFCQFAYLTAISYSNAGTATVLQYLGPVLVMLYVCLRESHLPSPREFGAVILAVTGTVILSTHGDLDNLALTPSALLWGLLAALGLAVYTILPGTLLHRFGNLAILAYGMLIGGVLLAVIKQVWTIPVLLDIKALLAIGCLIIFGTVLPFSLYLYGVECIGAIKASMLASSEPLTAVLLSALWLDTKFLPPDIIGIVFILLTVGLLSRDKSHKKPAVIRKEGLVNDR